MNILLSANKTCSKCKRSKHTGCFTFNAKNKDGLNYHCRSCTRKYCRNWYEVNKETRKPQMLAYIYANLPDNYRRVREYRARKKLMMFARLANKVS